jgi:RNA-directed DNA polymerase
MRAAAISTYLDGSADHVRARARSNPLLRRINDHLVRWACRKYKRLRRREKRAKEFLARVARRFPALFAHWRFGLKPDGWTMGAV